MKLLISVVLGASIVAVTPPASAHGFGTIEANFLVNLFRYVSWPNSPPDTATICFLGPSDVYTRLESGVSRHESWAQLPNRKVIVKMLSEAESKALAQPEDSPGCQVLFLDTTTAKRVWPTLSASQMPASVLTVSTQDDFAYNGGTIQIRWEEADAYRLLLNQASVRRAGVTVSVDLVNLADIVDEARYLNR